MKVFFFFFFEQWLTVLKYKKPSQNNSHSFSNLEEMLYALLLHKVEYLWSLMSQALWEEYKE